MPKDARPSPSRPSPDWLSRALCRAGIFGPDEVDEAIASGRVQLAGRVVRAPLTPVRRSDTVRVDGRERSLDAPVLVLAFHKPKGLLTSTEGQHGAGTVFEALLPTLAPPLRKYRWHAVGRLDRDTTGLLLFTNDERLVEHVTRPGTGLGKRYLATVSGRLTEAKRTALLRGVSLPDGEAKATSARALEDGRVELVLTEGRNHQVKRMLGAVGLPVLSLHREAIGGVQLDVPLGGHRMLPEDELGAGLRWPPPAGP